ncbi:SRPBCC family protein [Planococcus shenhongbingii]|uniref:SRPBCC family protein n=1 Tax=Planococcus shenhongbingii TaxID=3058398 RepID=UPI002622DE39|nr:SRPBCC family protein [Planococcus sp. N016]WKA56859.1 SRPBCC family protein [Planococcus sp. N016]
MITWSEEKIIDANIEKIWNLFADENIQKIMPKVERHRLIEKQPHEVGAKHEQTYREGKRAETYVVETLAYEDRDDKKFKKTSFVLGGAFQVTFAIALEKIGKDRTKFTYSGQNKGINFVGRAMLKLGSEKSNMRVVHEFMGKVEQQALKN